MMWEVCVNAIYSLMPFHKWDAGEAAFRMGNIVLFISCFHTGG